MKKKLVFLFIFLFLVLASSNIYAKYMIEYTNTVANIKIDTVVPQIQLANISNTNKISKNCASRNHTLKIRIRIIEKNIKENNFNIDNVKIMVGEKEILPGQFEIEKISQTNQRILYALKLSQIVEEGELKIKIKEGTIVDISGNKNNETILNSNIKIDNTAPVVIFKQQEISNGKINGSIEANEEIIEVNGWNLSENKTKLSKEFANNVTYPFVVTDFAENKSIVDINITKATNIKFMYGSINQWSGLSSGYGNNEIAGKEAIMNNTLYKTELIVLNYEGDIDNDFIQIQNYMYTHWGESKKGLGYAFENVYNYGFNPGENSYATMSSKNTTCLGDKNVIILGGDGVNSTGNRGLNYGEAITKEIEEQHLYGVSGLRIKLRDYSEYSIIYQIWVKDSGWQKVASDGELTMLNFDKPFSAFRISLIPKTEKQYLIDFWNKDINYNSSSNM